MKELRKKTNSTILLLLSAILVSAMVLLNLHSYGRESENLRRNLDILDSRKDFHPEGTEEIPPFPEESAGKKRDSSDLRNMMVMDYELYTVRIREGEISEIISHGNESEAFDAEKAAKEIMEREQDDAFFVGNLYLDSYSYRYHYMDSMVIVNNQEVKKKLWELLVQSLLIFLALEAVIILASKRITRWIAKPAEEAFERQKEFIADASHELKTPLAVIMASAEEIPQREENRKYLETISYETDRMSHLITGLLNLSRLEGGGASADFREEDLSRILSKTCLSYEGVAFEQGVGIRTNIEEGLMFRCVKEEIEQMAATLLDNAVSHSYRDTSVGGSAEYLKGKSTVRLRVTNTGAK